MDKDDGIAVVGASALFPGSIDGASFWRNILEGRDFMTEVPADHWLIDDYYDADPSKPGKVYAKRGAFLPKIDFDPMLHGIPPMQLSTTDTAQLLALIVANKVLDDAASVQFGKVSRKDISVILGIASATELVGQMVAKIQRPHWTKALRDAQLPESQVQDICNRIEATYPTWDESTFPGLLGNVVAGRIANRLDLGGTNCVVDAACASSLGAVAMAVQELRSGNSDLVITGGADALNDIFMYMCFSKTPALSPSGDCRPFSENADGTMLGEGIGMVALRRLADAERDGDKIYAVIRGVGSSSDGRAKSIYAPRAEGQEMALRRAYERAGYGAHEVELIEAHGTGTKAGDAAEFSGLRRAFQDVPRTDRQWCALGSVKSQIGHTKAAAGSASLFKIVMALHHKVLPPTIKVDKPNAKMEIANSPFYLNTATRPWIHTPHTTRKGSVSAFGFGGSNFHVTLEEYVGDKSTALRFSSLPVQMLLLHGADADALIARAREYQGRLASGSLPLLARESQLAFDATASARLAVLSADAQAATADLATAINTITKDKSRAISMPGRMHYSTGTDVPPMAFLFPGQGSQYVNMGADLAVEFASVRQLWDATAAMDLDSEHKLHQVVFPIPVFSDAERAAQTELLTRTHWAQPAIGATSLSMLHLLRELGVQATAAAGHSYGEVTALYAAGAITTPASMLTISRKRGELMHAAASTPGSMTAVFASEQQVQKLMAEHATVGVTIANINSPSQVVIAGKTPAIELCEAMLKAAKVSFRRLPVATAFHTELVAGSAEPFEAFLSETPIVAPGMRVYANTTAKSYPTEPDAIRTTLAWQLANPVRFEELVGRMYEDGYRIFLEVGPGSVLTGMVADCLQNKPHVAVSLDNRKADGRTALFNALGVLSANGVVIDYAKLWQEFVPFAAVQDAPKLSPATVKLSGANYGKPYPPAEGSVAVPKPNPERPAIVAVPPSAAIVAPRERTEPVPGTVRQAVAPQVLPATIEMARPSVDANWLAAFQTMQQQTLESQKAFAQTLSDTHLAFLRTSETAFAQLGQLAGASSGAVPGVMPVHAVPTARAAVHAPAQPVPPPAQPLPVVASVTRAQMPVAPAPRTVATPAASAQSVDFEGMLMAVVADKTGYPIEMLTLDMELESGLGIDSIK
ncbi:MAG: acyltransferase domain-containing protein, partial [Aquimonas sp.]|nr:acyltransferase domain-containing protein [Aquimonas sp.]